MFVTWSCPNPSTSDFSVSCRRGPYLTSNTAPNTLHRNSGFQQISGWVGMPDENEEWKVVKRGTKNCAKWKQVSVDYHMMSIHNDCGPSIEGIKAVKNNIEQSQFWVTLLHQVECIVNNITLSPETLVREGPPSSSDPWLIVLGIGSKHVVDPSIFASQLSIALLLRDRWNIPSTRTWVSDPVMSPQDCALIDDLGLTSDKSFIKEQNQIRNESFISVPLSHTTGTDTLAPVSVGSSHSPKLASHSPKLSPSSSFISLPQSFISFLQFDSSPILLFMPHCDKPLYGECFRLIDAFSNSNPSSALSRCVLIGNDLTQYDTFQAQRFYQDNFQSSHISSTTAQPTFCFSLAEASVYLDQLLPSFQSISINPVDVPFPRAFNNLSITVVLNTNTKQTSL